MEIKYQEFKPNTYICSRDELIDKIYIILDGKVSIVVKN